MKQEDEVGHRGPGPKAQHLGAKLRDIRESCDLSQTEVAQQLTWSKSKLSRLESGKRYTDSEDVATILAIYGVTGDERETLIAMARTPDELGWVEAMPGVTAESVTLAAREDDAIRITNWSPLLVPGLRQNVAYSRAFMLADGVPELHIPARLLARKERQERLLGNVEHVAYIDESVLRRTIGSPQIMAAQLRSLAEAAERGAELRVLPLDAGAQGGLIGPFVALEYADSEPIIHIEMSRSAVFLTKRTEVEHYFRTMARLNELSLDASQSARLMTEIATELD